MSSINLCPRCRSANVIYTLRSLKKDISNSGWDCHDCRYEFPLGEAKKSKDQEHFPVCPYCQGKKTCGDCNDRGWVRV